MEGGLLPLCRFGIAAPPSFLGIFVMGQALCQPFLWAIYLAGALATQAVQAGLPASDRIFAMWCGGIYLPLTLASMLCSLLYF